MTRKAAPAKAPAKRSAAKKSSSTAQQTQTRGAATPKPDPTRGRGAGPRRAGGTSLKTPNRPSLSPQNRRRGLLEAVAVGRRETLEALVVVLAAEIETGVTCKTCGGPLSSPTATLAKQLRDAMAELAKLPAKEASAVADIAAGRAARLAAKASDPPRVRGQRGTRSGRARSERRAAP